MKDRLQEQHQPFLARKLLLLSVAVLASIPSTSAAAFQPKLPPFSAPTNSRRWDNAKDNRPYFGLQKSTINHKSLGLGKNEEKEEEETPSEKIRRAAAFTVVQLQLKAAEKLEEEERKGEVDPKKQEILLKLLELTMGGGSYAPPSETPSSTPDASSAESSPSTSKQDEIDKKKTQKILDDLDSMMKPTSETKLPVAAPASADTSKKSDTPTKEDAKVEKIESKMDISKEKSKTEEAKKKEAVSRDEIEAKVKTRTNSNLPQCVSTEFGQALPVLAEGLPPLREPLVASKAPSLSTKKTDATQLAEPAAIKEKESSVATLEKPIQTPPSVDAVDSSVLPPVEETKTAINTNSLEAVAPPVPESVTVEGEKDSLVQPTEAEVKGAAEPEQPAIPVATVSEKASASVIIPPPPKEEEKVEEATGGETDQVIPTSVAAKEEEEASDDETRILVPPPPKYEVEEESPDTKPKLRFPPPPKPDTEDDDGAPSLSVDKGEEESPDVKPKVRFPPNPKGESETKEIEDAPVLAGDKEKEEVPDRPKTEAEIDAAVEQLAKQYASMPVGERAAAILKDLGMYESHPDPDDPDYDNSNDDEIWKGHKS